MRNAIHTFFLEINLDVKTVKPTIKVMVLLGFINFIGLNQPFKFIFPPVSEGNTVSSFE